MQKDTAQWLIPILLAAAAGIALWYYWMEVSEVRPAAEVSAPASPAVVEPRTLPGPLHPISETLPDTSTRPELTLLPALADSDEFFRLELSEIYGAMLGDLLADSGVIEKIVATIDNLPRQQIAERIRPLGSIGGQFEIGGQDGRGGFSISADNYRRYDALVELVSNADLDAVVDMYERFYPLLQSAYVEIGYPDGYFNDRLVEVIDHLLETPEQQGPVALVRPHVLYEYADPALQSRSSGQKLLLRMGPQHMASVKQTLRSLRVRVAQN